MTDHKQNLLKALLQIQQEVIIGCSGICYNVEVASANIQGADDLAMFTIMRSLWKAWPEYSGNPSYPVPHPHLLPRVAFDFYQLSLWEGEYGEARKRLLNYLITKLQEEGQ